MWIFEKGLEIIDIKKYKKDLGKESIESITQSMARDYFDSSKHNKLIIKYRLQDILNDIDKVTTIPIVISLLVLVLGNIYKENKNVVIIASFIIFVMISVYLMELVKYYRVCKLYLQVIKDVDEGRLNLSSIK